MAAPPVVVRIWLICAGGTGWGGEADLPGWVHVMAYQIRASPPG
jgi:hypothetical protein